MRFFKGKFAVLSGLMALGVLMILGGSVSSEASAGSWTRRFDPVLDEQNEDHPESPASREFFVPGSQLFQMFRAGLNPLLRADGAGEVQERYFTQRLNPSDPADQRAYQQRYYVYSGHASGPGAPVVLYIGGEAELTPRNFIGRFTEKVAETLQAHVVAVEHRYYGKSQPFALLTPDNLRYLSTENAIADLARFQEFAMKKLGLRGKWIAIGGSYPGSLSAYYRLKHPELVVGALASSAPVQAKNNFEEYDAHVTRVLGEKCAEPLREVSRAAESALLKGEFAEFKARFGASDVEHDVDFLYVLADVTAYAVQYGSHDRLCREMLGAADPVSAYAKYSREFLESQLMTAAEFSPAVAMKLGADESGGMRQWYYQSCREYGYWQDAHHDPRRSVRSSRINAAYDREVCSRFFGLSEVADESRINSAYYAPLLDPAQASRILFTNGSNDPWQALSITHERGNDTNPRTQAFMIEGKAHCSDLKAAQASDPEPLQRARRLFLDLASDWVSSSR